MNLPNKLTMARIVMIPFFMLMMELNQVPYNYLIAFAIFAIASLTDLLDGKIARKYNLITDFGKIMDPLADKLLVTAALIYFVQLQLAFAWVVALILARELTVTSLRVLAAGKGIVLAADKWGKYKTATTMIWICYTLILCQLIVVLPESNMLRMGVNLHYLLMSLSVAFTVASGVNYVWKNKDLLKG